jgi:hypothetical protein
MLRSSLTFFSILALASFAGACSEGTGTDGDAVMTDSDDDDSTETAESATEAPTDETTTPTDSAATQPPPEPAPSTPSAGTAETLIDVASVAIPPYINYPTEKEFLNVVAPEETMIAVTQDEGNPAPSLRLDVPFSNYNQFIEFEYLSDMINNGVPWDLTGKVLTLNVKVEAAGFTDPMCPGGIRFYIKTGADYAYGGAPWFPTPAAAPGWKSFVFDVTRATPGEGVTALDLTDVRSIGVAFESADCGGTYLTGDPPPEVDAPVPAIFYMEDITVSDASP